MRDYAPAPASGNGMEQTDFHYWDFVVVEDGFTDAQFFVTPMGQQGKKKADTNLVVSGQITDGLRFELHGIAFGLRDNGAAQIPEDEVRIIHWNGMLEFSINHRIQFQTPLSALGWGGGPKFQPDAASAGTAVWNSSGDQSRMSFYKLRNIVVIPKAVTFEIFCYWNGAVTLAADRELGVRLEGRLVRASVGS